jgi:hypothetical protein
MLRARYGLDCAPMGENRLPPDVTAERALGIAREMSRGTLMERNDSAADSLDEPIVVARAIGTAVVNKDRQRR